MVWGFLDTKSNTIKYEKNRIKEINFVVYTSNYTCKTKCQGQVYSILTINMTKSTI